MNKVGIEEELKEYKKLGRGNWGEGFGLLKGMYGGFINQIKDEATEMELEEIMPPMKMILNLLLDLRKARSEGTKICMHPFNYGPELFYTMGLVPLMQELFSVGLATTHINEYYLDITNKIGYGDNPTLCNAQRPLIGAYMQKAAPIPDLMFFLSTPCNSLSITYQVFQHLTDVPLFNIDIPYWAHEHSSEFYDEKIMDYMLSQLKNFIPWLEKQTNRKFEVEKFQETMRLVNQSREYVSDFNELLKTVPCPVPSIAGFGNWAAMTLRGGTSEGVEVTKYIRDQAAERVKEGLGGVEDEKLRIAWPYTHVFFDQTLFKWLEEEFQAVTIMDILGFYPVGPHDTSTLEKCYESLALGTLDYSMIGTCRGPIDYFVDFIINWIKEYKIDCVIIPMQFACKHAYAMTTLATEIAREETGVPILVFGCDPYDSREVPSETIRAKISEFLNQIVL